MAFRTTASGKTTSGTTTSGTTTSGTVSRASTSLGAGGGASDPGPRGVAPIRLGLDAVRAALGALGNPQRATPTVLVAGTNGKGSVAAMLEAIARAAGLRVGLFLSPSLGEEHEMVRVDGSPLEARRFAELRDEVEEASEALDMDTGESLTPFELTTATAFLAFARHRLDLAVVEAGLGGARDATNVADPVASVLVTVDLDHGEYLGPTLDAIAREKAGIFRRRRPAILGYLRAPALRAARERAEEIGARVITARSRVEKLRRDPRGGLELVLDGESHLLEPALEGEHQARNAALAALTALTLRARFPALDSGAVARGIATAHLPGRLEWITDRVLLDAAHNPAAARALAAHLEGQGRRLDLLFGAFADKDHRGMLEILRPHVGRLWLTPLDHPRSWRPAEHLSAFGGQLVESPADGLRRALEAPGPQLLVTGSVHLVGEARRVLECPPLAHAAPDVAAG